MVSLAVHPGSRCADQNCVWAEAGLLAYKLCDRDFDCEHCPLDAALRGATLMPAPLSERPCHAPAVSFPDDRLYSRTHTWMKPAGSGMRIRFGLDGFAAVFLGSPRRARQLPNLLQLQKDQVFCMLEVEGGLLPLSTPLPAEICAWNAALATDPGAMVADPYGAGWIAEMTLDPEADAAILLHSGAARRQAQFDDRRFRRRVAFELLADADEPGADGVGQIGPDLPHILGAVRYLSLVRELVH
ncbi:MAG: hypothetical protein ACF8R7_10735 [Phycisphaerales bacterium JB039]